MGGGTDMNELDAGLLPLASREDLPHIDKCIFVTALLVPIKPVVSEEPDFESMDQGRKGAH